MRHPAKYTDCFFDTFAEMLQGVDKVLDPFAGTGKIGKLKQFGFTGKIYANELEPEWLVENEYSCDVLTFCDAEFLDYPKHFFDAICTSPTYGNRMADHHNAKDGSRRNTYTHCLGRQLDGGNTGKMQWGIEYMEKHERIYAHLATLVKPGGKFVLNVKNHIRRGVEIDVTAFHVSALEQNGFSVIEKRMVTTPSLKFGANAEKRLSCEYIILLQKNGRRKGKHMIESKRRAKKKYQKNITRLTVDFYPTEKPLIDKINEQPKKQTYIKDLIRADIKKEESST